MNKPFRRKIYDELLAWKNEKPKNSALLIEGGRRVGKTTIVKEFAKNEYKDYIYVDFSKEDDEMKNLFKKIKNLDDFFANFFILCKKDLIRGNLIIFDEIQFCPLARQAIKTFVEDGRYEYIETGSLLSIRDNTSNILIPSEERRLEMYPLDYEEFLWAFGEDKYASLLRDIYDNKKKIDNDSHKSMLSSFRKYMAIGGMPKVISIYQNTLSYKKVEQEKRDIIELYKEDLLKHDRKYHTLTRVLYDSMIPQLMSKNSSRYKLESTTNKRYRNIQDSVFDLADSKIVNIVNLISDPSPGLELSRVDSMFKIYPNDIGLFVSSIFKTNNKNIDDIYRGIIFNKIGANFGMIFEAYVAQALLCLSYHPYYHTYTLNGKRYEIDFIVQDRKHTTAIEVKSGEKFSIKSLEALSNKYKQTKFNKIVVCNKPICAKDNILYLPIYMLFCLR